MHYVITALIVLALMAGGTAAGTPLLSSKKVGLTSSFASSASATRDQEMTDQEMTNLLRPVSSSSLLANIRVRGGSAVIEPVDKAAFSFPTQLVTRAQVVKLIGVANAPFGVAMLLSPDFIAEMLFQDWKVDGHHHLLSRMLGVKILSDIYSQSKMSVEDAYPAAILSQIALFLVGPLVAQFTLDPKPLHSGVLVLQAFLGLAALLAF